MHGSHTHTYINTYMSTKEAESFQFSLLLTVINTIITTTMQVKSSTCSVRRGSGVDDEEWWVSPFLIAVLTFNFLAEVRRSLDRPAALAFVAFSYSDLALLFWCIHKFEQEEENAARKERLKMAICTLLAALVTVFTHRLAAITPPAVKVALWSTAGLSMCGALYVCLQGKTIVVGTKQQKVEGHDFESHKSQECMTCDNV